MAKYLEEVQIVESKERIQQLKKEYDEIKDETKLINIPTFYQFLLKRGIEIIHTGKLHEV